MKKKILIVEDEKPISEILEYTMMREGYEAVCSFNGAQALELALQGNFDLILLDVMLPGLDGFEVCRKVREKLDTPIIMLTAREEEADKVMGLELGADDYMTKPFSHAELVSRIKANIRRYHGETRVSPPLGEPVSENVIVVGDIRIDTKKYSVSKNGVEISLSKKEYDVLEFFAKNRGTVFQREEIMEKVWGYDGFFGDLRTVDVTLSRIRKKIEVNPAEPEYIQNKRGVGYFMS
ncbi:MAG: response regulator transcription factor [Clostridia bacterium]|nr:response regulator transcription factor [Clostridia bacterium]